MKEKNNIIKKILAGLFISGMALSAALSSSGTMVFAAQKLYSQVETETVTKGVTYTFDHRLTADGWQDIHVLTMDLSDPNITVRPVESSTAYGLKETVQKLITDSGAVAGVNADYFGMSGEYSASFGPVIKDGELISAGTDRNAGTNDYTSFFLDMEGNPFMDYFKIMIQFLNNGQSFMELASINKVTAMEYPMYLDRNAMADTSQIDARFSDLTKIVVENGYITKISAKGETVTIPENGYIIVLNSSYADALLPYYAVGQTAEFQMVANVDISKIAAGIGGGERIVADGANSVASIGTYVTSKGRQPRTALGISQDGTRLIMMVVDGRTHSIGATHDELANLMLEYGAYDAMNLDGGGSSTMVVKEPSDAAPEVVNTVSDGAARKVINAVGIFNNGPLGEVSQIVLEASQQRVFQGNDVTLEVYGLDEYYHKIDIPVEQVQFTSDDGTGVFTGNVFTPAKAGKVNIMATYGNMQAAVTIESLAPASISPEVETISLNPGESTTLSISGVSVDGYSVPITKGVTYQLSDPSLGSIADNVFTAGQSSSGGYIQCIYQGMSCYIKVATGTIDTAVTSFEDKPAVTFSCYPEGSITGSVSATNQFYNDGNTSLEMTYQFAVSTETQAAYMDFTTPVAISGTPTALKLSIYGNHSGDWVRGRIIDAEGTVHVIDFTRDMSWDGWQEMTAEIPDGVVYPISLKTVYVAALQNTDTNPRTVRFDRLNAAVPNTASISVPENPKVRDVKEGQVGENTAEGYFINIAGNVVYSADQKPANYTDARVQVLNQLQTNSDLMIYGSSSDITAGSSVETITWDGSYHVTSKPNVDIIQISAAEGGIRKTNALQWLYLQTDLLNSANKNIIFITDQTPSLYDDEMEAQLFRDLLKSYVDAGKNIFVVSSSGTSAWNTVREGVSYINLPNLWNTDGTLNSNAKILSFNCTQNGAVYQLKNLY